MTDETIDMTDPMKASFAYIELRIKYELLKSVADEMAESITQPQFTVSPMDAPEVLEKRALDILVKMKAQQAKALAAFDALGHA